MSKTRSLFLLVSILGCVALLLAQQRTPPETKPAFLIITHANVIDGVSAQPLHDARVLVRDGRIESVLTGYTEPPAGAVVLDLKGRWLLPGFVDAHVHLNDLRAARTALASGVTTARSLGGS